MCSCKSINKERINFLSFPKTGTLGHTKTKQFRTQFESMTLYSNEDERWGKHFVPYSIRSFYATTRLQNGTSTYALCKNMGMTEPYLRKHYSKYMNRLATDELLKVNRNLGIKGKVFDGDDFIIKDVELEGN